MERLHVSLYPLLETSDSVASHVVEVQVGVSPQGKRVLAEGEVERLEGEHRGKRETAAEVESVVGAVLGEEALQSRHLEAVEESRPQPGHVEGMGVAGHARQRTRPENEEECLFEG